MPDERLRGLRPDTLVYSYEWFEDDNRVIDAVEQWALRPVTLPHGWQFAPGGPVRPGDSRATPHLRTTMLEAGLPAEDVDQWVRDVGSPTEFTFSLEFNGDHFSHSTITPQQPEQVDETGTFVYDANRTSYNGVVAGLMTLVIDQGDAIEMDATMTCCDEFQLQGTDSYHYYDGSSAAGARAMAMYLSAPFHRWGGRPRMPPCHRGTLAVASPVERSAHDAARLTASCPRIVRSALVRPSRQGAGREESSSVRSSVVVASAERRSRFCGSHCDGRTSSSLPTNFGATRTVLVQCSPTTINAPNARSARVASSADRQLWRVSRRTRWAGRMTMCWIRWRG